MAHEDLEMESGAGRPHVRESYGESRMQAARWYDLYSRGARDWLRHNEKVRQSVKDALPRIVAGPDVLTQPENRTVRVPVRFLEHYRFRLRGTDRRTGAGQGAGVEPGDVLRPADPDSEGRAGAGTGEGGVDLVLELKVDDILDWIGEELKLPHLQPRPGTSVEDQDYVREGWDRRGVRARLDRRRTLREAIKRRAVQGGAVPFSDDDLRFRQLAARPRPSTVAVVCLVLDVSSSMDEQSRKLAKSFFFWALQGIRRTHAHIETVFIGHTVRAWEFSEEEFFSVRGAGGTEASCAFQLASEILADRYESNRYNNYLFYASDGDNFSADRSAARERLGILARTLNFMGFLELVPRDPERMRTEMARIFSEMIASGAPGAIYSASNHEDIWEAIRQFFVHEAAEQTADGRG